MLARLVSVSEAWDGVFVVNGHFVFFLVKFWMTRTVTVRGIARLWSGDMGELIILRSLFGWTRSCVFDSPAWQNNNTAQIKLFYTYSNMQLRSIVRLSLFDN